MLHTELPIYKKGCDLLSLALDVQRQMPRAYLGLARSMRARSQSMPAASILAHCAAVRRIERSNSFCSGGVGGRPRGGFGASIARILVTQQSIATRHLLCHINTSQMEDDMSRGPGKRTPEQRLLAKARAEGECLVWFGDKDSNGYGRLRHAGQKGYPAHKLMFELHHGPVPEGQVVRHRCDNPPCIKLAHLIVGTVAQNVGDMFERGRANRAAGEAHGRAKLTQAQVDEARARYVPGQRGAGIRVLAAEYGVAMSTMRAALSGDHWKPKP